MRARAQKVENCRTSVTSRILPRKLAYHIRTGMRTGGVLSVPGEPWAQAETLTVWDVRASRVLS